MEVRSAEVIATCLQLGVVVTINQRLDMDTIVTVADEFGFEARPMEEEEEEEELQGGSRTRRGSDGGA